MEATIFAGLISALIGYLLGSISFAVIVSRIYAKDDVRNHGSHNAGMTNVLRVYGVGPAVFTLLGDFAKGIVAVLIGRMIFHAFGIDGFDAGYIAGMGALLGHLFPVWFGFRGGKGVLTSIGIMLAVNPLAIGLILLVMLPFVFIVRIVSLASITGAALLPLVTYMLLCYQDKPALVDTCLSAVFALIVIWMHRSNIKRLINGTEKRLTLPKKEDKNKQ